jgi:hypothetical protein
MAHHIPPPFGEDLDYISKCQAQITIGLRSMSKVHQTPTALRYSGFSSLEYCISEIKKAISTIASYSIAKKK